MAPMTLKRLAECRAFIQVHASHFENKIIMDLLAEVDFWKGAVKACTEIDLFGQCPVCKSMAGLADEPWIHEPDCAWRLAHE